MKGMPAPLGTSGGLQAVQIALLAGLQPPGQCCFITTSTPSVLASQQRRTPRAQDCDLASLQHALHCAAVLQHQMRQCSIQNIILHMTCLSRKGMQCKKRMMFIMVGVHNIELGALLVIQAQALN